MRPIEQLDYQKERRAWTNWKNLTTEGEMNADGTGALAQ